MKLFKKTETKKSENVFRCLSQQELVSISGGNPIKNPSIIIQPPRPK